MAIFAMQPWEQEACDRLPTDAEQVEYRAWVDQVGQASARAHVALAFQPDAPFALCAPGGSDVPLGPDALRHGTVLPAQPNSERVHRGGRRGLAPRQAGKGAADPAPAGVSMARGFALNSTHYDSTARQVRFAAAISQALAARGIPGKYAVINTAQNGKPFKGYEYDGPNYDNARPCSNLADKRCVTLGVPPTSDVAHPAWGLESADAAAAAAYVDGYLWSGRPRLFNQASGWAHERALSPRGPRRRRP